MNGLLQSHDKTLKNEELLLMDEQRKCFLQMRPTPGEDAGKIADVITQDLEYCIQLVERIDSSFERTSIVGKTPCNSITCYR